MTPLLSIGHLHKRFGQRTLLQIDNLAIDAASAYVLTGINGSGKSTLLRILCGLEPADVAQAAYLGQPVQLAPYPPQLRATIGYVHQHPAMFATSVEHNIGYGLQVRGTPLPERRARVSEAMEWAGVAHLGERNPNTLSGGEKQRVALARARILKPRLLLLDEPCSNLDGAAREQVIALIPALVKEGSSVVMACHDRDLIALAGIKRFKLRDGRLLVR